MALSILTHPPALILAYQPVSFTLQGSASGLPLRIAGGPTNLDGDSIQADDDKKATLELSDYLQGLITLRGQSGNVPVIYTDLPKAISFTFIEWAGDPPVNNYDVEETGYYLLDGYIPKSRRKAIYATYSSLLAYLVASKSCLTWFPAAEPKRILPDQADYLNFLQVANAGAINITQRITFLFTDGTSAADAIVNTVQNVDFMKLVYFPVGYTQLSMAIIMAQAYPDKVLAGYQVVFKTGSTVISQVYNYTLDTAWYENPRTLILRNAFGLYEVFVCTGLSQQDNEIKPSTAETDGLSLPEKLNWKVEETETVRVNTGFLTALQMKWLSDMNFVEAYELISGVMHPIVFKDLKLPVVHDGEYQYSAELEYDYAFNETTEAG